MLGFYVTELDKIKNQKRAMIHKLERSTKKENENMKKIKKLIVMVLCLCTVISMCACSGDKNSTNENGSSQDDKSKSTSDEVKTIKIFQFKVDTINQMQDLADRFCEQYDGNVKIEVETVGGSGDYVTTLKTKFASEEVPDMFCATKYCDLEIFEEYIIDLASEPWIENCIDGTLTDITKDGKIYGQPMVIEPYGFIYNKDLFEQAGIQSSPTTYSELEETCKKLMDAGIMPFVNGYKEGWVLGQHFLNGALLSKVDMDGIEFANRVGISETFADQMASKEMAKLLKLTVDYGLPNSIAEDYNTSIADFAAGRAAIISQGVWIQPSLDQLNPDMNLGMFGYLTNDEDDVDVLPTGVSGYWVVNKDSKYIKEIKDFLTYMATNEEAVKSLVENFKFMPPFKGVEYDVAELGNISVAADEYIKAGKTTQYYWTRLPEGFIAEYTPSLQAFCADQITEDELINKLDESTKSIRK